MASTDRWSSFRKFRKYIFSLAAILCLIWTILISVYLARNWSSYDGAQQGILIAMIVLNAISAILLYLMIVVHYDFWPDVARTTFLVAAHAATSAVFTVFTGRSNFPCNAFGSTSNCQRMTTSVIVGSWIISGLLTAVALGLPFMAFIPLPPRPQNGSDELENPSDDPIDALRKSQMSSGSHAGLLKHREGLSVDAADLPPHPGLPNMTRPPSLSSSRSSLVAQRRPMQVEAPKSESSGHEPSTPSTGSVYSATSPRSSMAQNTPGLMMERNGSMASSLRYPAVMPTAGFSASSRLPLPRQIGEVASNSRPQSGQSSSTVGTSLSAFDEYTRMSGVTEGFVPRPSLPASPSPRYSPPSASGPPRRYHNQTRSLSPNLSGPRVSDGGVRHLPSSSLSSVYKQATEVSDSKSIRSMSASLHNRPESAVLSNGINGSEYSLRYSQNSAVSPRRTAVATPPSLANQPHSSFELRRSESARVEDVPISESPTDERGAQLDDYEEMEEIVVTPRPNREALARFRMDSTGSIVDMEEWRKLVFNAAGRAL